MIISITIRAFLNMVNYHYGLNLDITDSISFIVESIRFSTEGMILLAISCFVKTDFEKISQQFQHFGSSFLRIMKFNLDLSKDEMDFIFDAFYLLILNNMGISQSELFPEKDIRSIKSKLQVELLLEGKNFILLPDVLVKCSDIQFKFK
jgi:hypothetical protein